MWALLGALAWAGCDPDPALGMRSTLYLGRDGSSPGAVRPFLQAVVSPVFPGFTVLRGRGWWEGRGERAVLVVVLHPADALDEVMGVAEAWRASQRQQAVLVETAPVVGRLVVEGCRADG